MAGNRKEKGKCIMFNFICVYAWVGMTWHYVVSLHMIIHVYFCAVSPYTQLIACVNICVRLPSLCVSVCVNVRND